MAFTIGLMLFLIIVLFPMITKAVDLADEVTEFNSYPARYHHQPVCLLRQYTLANSAVLSIILSLFVIAQILT